MFQYADREMGQTRQVVAKPPAESRRSDAVSRAANRKPGILWNYNFRDSTGVGRTPAPLYRGAPDWSALAWPTPSSLLSRYGPFSERRDRLRPSGGPSDTFHRFTPVVGGSYSEALPLLRPRLPVRSSIQAITPNPVHQCRFTILLFPVPRTSGCSSRSDRDGCRRARQPP